MKIFVLLSRFPYPLEKGDKLRAFHHIKELSKNHEVILCALTDKEVKQSSIDILSKYCASIEIIKLPMPRLFTYPIEGKETRLPASYANFYIGNAAVLVPTFDDSQDEKVLAIFRTLFPKRRVVGIDSRDLVLGLGGVHCVTQQMP